MRIFPNVAEEKSSHSLDMFGDTYKGEQRGQICYNWRYKGEKI